jgi:hypothetical protein
MAYTPKLTYKGKPLVRKDNELYYGSMTDPYVLYLQILTTTPVGEQQVLCQKQRPLLLFYHQGTAGARSASDHQARPVQCAGHRRHLAAEGQREPLNQFKMNNAGQSADCPALRFYRDDLEWPSRALWPYS